ncbi:MAG TPA: VanZ family protein [Flavisolibacter sp.]|nr:VanZ family protein [Flavisolibacter sp.]
MPLSRLISLFFFFIYLLILLKLTVFREPLPVMAGHFRHYHIKLFREGYFLANFVPFKTIYYYLSLQEVARNGIENIGGNMAVFLPFGLLFPLCFPRFKQFGKTVLAAFMTSLFLECLQLVFALGSFDVDDLLLNTVGGVIGYGILSFFIQAKRDRHHKSTHDNIQQRNLP